MRSGVGHSVCAFELAAVSSTGWVAVGLLFALSGISELQMVSQPAVRESYMTFSTLNIQHGMSDDLQASSSWL